MISIAIETTGRTGSLAVLKGDQAIWQRQLDGKKRTAAVTTVALHDLLSQCEKNDWQPSWISVANGPGSFTGLRIGVTTAKTLGYARGLPIVSVDSLSSIAMTVATELTDEETDTEKIVVGLNAYRGEVFAAEFAKSDLVSKIPDEMKFPDTSAKGESAYAAGLASQISVKSAEQWDSWLNERNEEPNCIFSGDAGVFTSLDEGRFVERTIADAVGVGRVGLRAAINGGREDAFSLMPNYFKLSAVEEKANR